MIFRMAPGVYLLRQALIPTAARLHIQVLDLLPFLGHQASGQVPAQWRQVGEDLPGHRGSIEPAQ